MEYKDFEKALGRLEEIVAELEKGELSLEDSVARFEEGVSLSRFCGDKLDEAERKVEMLVRDGRGELTTVPLENGTKHDED